MKKENANECIVCKEKLETVQFDEGFIIVGNSYYGKHGGLFDEHIMNKRG